MRSPINRGGVILPVPPERGDNMLGRHFPAEVHNHHRERNEKLQPLSAEERAEKLNGAVRTLEQMFPDICPNQATDYMRLLVSVPQQGVELALPIAVEHYLLNGYPVVSRKTNAASTSNRHSAARSVRTQNDRESQKQKELVDPSDSDSNSTDLGLADDDEDTFYDEWCVFRLSMDFPKIGKTSLKNALKVFGGELGPTYKAVCLHYQRAAEKKGIEFTKIDIPPEEASEDVTWLPKGRLKLLKWLRAPENAPFTGSPRFEKEWRALQLELRSWQEPESDGDDLIDEFEDDVPDAIPTEVLIECGCCCSENPFEELVQCADGHLFCTECLRRHFEGYIFGGSQTCGLPTCMDTNGCDKTFPWSEVERALPGEVLSKYEQRQAEDAVSRAKLEGLVYCPFCNHPWEIDPGMEVLRCLNEKCRKASCIKCKKPNHHPLRCEDVEEESETSLRRKVEELMTKALIRECISCKAELVKVDGCNKITCRCGQTMCYVCRKPIKDYSHFCQHVREPGRACVQCAGCSLWERENEAEVVKAAKRAAIEEVGAQDPNLLKRAIGPSDDSTQHKRLRQNGRPLI